MSDWHSSPIALSHKEQKENNFLEGFIDGIVKALKLEILKNKNLKTLKPFEVPNLLSFL